MCTHTAPHYYANTARPSCAIFPFIYIYFPDFTESEQIPVHSDWRNFLVLKVNYMRPQQIKSSVILEITELFMVEKAHRLVRWQIF